MCIKHVGIINKVAWNIRNYRYVGDVSGPACHPLCTIKLSFLGFFLAPHIWSLAFFFRSPAASQTLIQLLLNGTRMSSSMYNKVSFLGLSLAPDIGHLPFSFDLMPTLKRWGCWLMGAACHPLWTIKVGDVYLSADWFSIQRKSVFLQIIRRHMA